MPTTNTSSAMAMRERIARAIYATCWLGWEHDSETARRYAESAADAVLAEMREPDEAMIPSLIDNSEVNRAVWRKIWQDMIDAATKADVASQET